jgi:hypothetical protein
MALYPSHRPSVSDDLRTGAATSANAVKKGVPLAGAEAQAVLVLSLGAPIAADDDGVCASQAVAGAQDLTINGALASGGVATFDVPRCVQVDADGAATAVFTIYGTDAYGASIRETITANGTTAVLGVKAFKTVTRVASSAATTGNVIIGTTTKLGLPYRPVVGGFIRGILNENTADAGTYVAPSRVTATATTVDVRGTYAPAGTLDGTNVYKVAIAVQNGPANSDAFGVTQFNG